VARTLSAQSPLETAVTLTREKRYAEARETLRDVSEPTVTSQRIAFRRLKAAIASGLGEPAAAAAEMRQARSLAPADPAIAFASAIAELGAGHLEPAIAAYRDAVKFGRTQEYSRSFAFELIRRQAFRPAIDILRDSRRTHSSDSSLAILLGIAEYAAGDIEEAITTLSDVIAADRDAEPAYRSLARIVLQSSAAPEPRVTEQLCRWDALVCNALKLRVARELGDANLMSAAAAALEQGPAANPIVACELARAREWVNRIGEARIYLEKCVALDPSPQNHFRLGVIYQRLGLPDLARAQMELRLRALGGITEEAANGLSALGVNR